MDSPSKQYLTKMADGEDQCRSVAVGDFSESEQVKELLAKIEELTAELNQRIQVCKEMDKIIMEEIGARDEAWELLDEITSAILGEPIGWTFHDAKWREALGVSKTLRQKLTGMRERFLDAAQRYAERRYRAGYTCGKNGKKDKAAEDAASQAFEKLLEAMGQ